MPKQFITLREVDGECTFADLDRLIYCSRSIRERDGVDTVVFSALIEVGKSYHSCEITEECFRGLLNQVEVLNNG